MLRRVGAQQALGLRRFSGLLGLWERGLGGLRNIRGLLRRHAAAQTVRDIAARVGQRILVNRTSLRFVQKVAQRLGVVVTQRVISRSISRWVPLVGAAAVGAYARYDTKKVGETTLEWLANGVLEEEVDELEVS